VVTPALSHPPAPVCFHAPARSHALAFTLQVKNSIAERLMKEMPKHISLLHDYTDEALDLETTLRQKLESLPAEEFEQVGLPTLPLPPPLPLLAGAIYRCIICADRRIAACAQVLHPVFQEDEFKLILVGAVLGMGVGFFQVFVLTPLFVGS
jgi:hypothetical protein